MNDQTKFKIAGIGEILWDLLPAGKQLGGAPANFAYHAQSLGADTRLISRIGDDELGREIVDRLKKLELPLDSVQVDEAHPTGTVSVELDAAGQAKYTINEGVAWDWIAASEEAVAAVCEADAVCFGSLAQRTAGTRGAVQALLAATHPGTLRIFDVNFRPPFVDRDVILESLKAANALKLNEHELPFLSEMFELPGTPLNQLAALAARFDLELIALTRGGEGSLLFADGIHSDRAGLSAKVADTIGAGDSFTAAMAIGFLKGWPLDQINRRANEIAAFVCSQSGATPQLPRNLRQPFLQA